jgi:hypothetical protein
MQMQSLFARRADPSEDRFAFIGVAVGLMLVLAALLAAKLLI